ncbi:MAG: hypothetical protein J0M35_07005 [Candidatus Obscuribacter phosphatis]|uniref:Uncharacterized protein n=1 Tax=Candidatus Obscuribacter phosphatis TaxID=1906157 RepID=A0A8J7TLM5_9BACT|nr:hypothetical protein [Candidatus Obscuribacter phosphatis]
MNGNQNKKSVLETWQALKTSCILGTRQSHSLPVGSGLLLQKLAFLEDEQNKGLWQSTEDLMLARLALASLALKLKAPISDALNQELKQVSLATAKEDDRAEAPARALSVLNQLLTDTSSVGQKLIGDWLSLCVEHNYVVSRQRLPYLLELFREKPSLVAKLKACGGERLRFLLSQNKDWHKLLENEALATESIEELTALFQEGTAKERTDALLRLRKLDFTQAESLIEKDFVKETLESRVSILLVLEKSLCQSDQAFLQNKAIADKRKEVRELAGLLLCRLYSSSYSQKLVSILRQRIKFAQKFELDLNDIERDIVDYEDLVVKQNTMGTLGTKARIVLNMLALADPLIFKTFCEPEALVQHINASEWREPLLYGLFQCLADYRKSPEKTQERDQIVSYLTDCLLESNADNLRESSHGINFLKSLSQEKTEKLVLSRLPRWSGSGGNAAPRLDMWNYLIHHDDDWSKDFSRTIAQFIIKELSEKVPALGYEFTMNAKQFAARMHPDTAELVPALHAAAIDKDYFAQSVSQMAEIIALRKELQEAFK